METRIRLDAVNGVSVVAWSMVNSRCFSRGVGSEVKSESNKIESKRR